MCNSTGNRNYLAAELEAACRILRSDNWQDRLGSVAWRVADSGARLRTLIKEVNGTVFNMEGVDVKTGFGAILPKVDDEELNGL